MYENKQEKKNKHSKKSILYFSRNPQYAITKYFENEKTASHKKMCKENRG